MNRTRRSIAAAVAVLCLAAPAFAADPPEKMADKPAAAPAPAKPTVTRNTVVPAAVAALTKEYKAYQKDPKAAKVRDKCTYFTENPSPEATPDAILKALESSVAGGPALEAYVKWQLLSGLPPKFPDELVKRAVAAYHRAPIPPEHPGLNKKTLDRAVKGLKKDEVAGAQRQFDEMVGQSAANYEVILLYRDEFYSHLPPKAEVLAAGLEDVAERGNRGHNANSIFESVAAGIKTWAISDAKPAQVKAMADTINRLQKSLAQDDIKPYSKINNEGKWAAGTPTVEPKKMEELVKFLESSAGSGGGLGGGIKFKDGK